MEKDNIEEIKKKAEKFESEYLKLKQEFKSYIETNRKNEEIKRQEIKTDSAKKLLVVADSLNRMSGSYSNISCDIVKDYSENLTKNIDVIYSQLLSVSGLIPIDPTAGDRFDEQMHLAIGLEYGTAYPENSVFRVIRKGYRIENSVVRPAEVIVSKRPVEVKVTRPGVWDRFLRWINPSKLRFVEINQKMDELERIQKEKTEKLTQDLGSLKNTIMELEAKNQNINEFGRIQKEKIEKLTQDINSLKNTIKELEEKIALKEHIPLQQGDVSSDTEQQYQGNEAVESNKNYSNIKEVNNDR